MTLLQPSQEATKQDTPLPIPVTSKVNSNNVPPSKPEGQMPLPPDKMPSFHFQRFPTHYATPSGDNKLPPTGLYNSEHKKPDLEQEKAVDKNSAEVDGISRSSSANKKQSFREGSKVPQQQAGKSSFHKPLEKGGMSASAKLAWGLWGQHAETSTNTDSKINEDEEEVDEEVSKYEDEKSEDAKSVADDADDEGGSVASDISSQDDADEVDDEGDDSASDKSKHPKKKPTLKAKVTYSNESKPTLRPKNTGLQKSKSDNDKKKAASTEAKANAQPKVSQIDSKFKQQIFPERKDQADEDGEVDDDNYSNIFDEDDDSEEEVEKWFQLKLPKDFRKNKKSKS